MVWLAELIVILELHQQGMKVAAIARRTRLHRSMVKKYVAGGIEPPVYGPRPPRLRRLAPFERYLRESLAAFPELTGRRLFRSPTRQPAPAGAVATPPRRRRSPKNHPPLVGEHQPFVRPAGGGVE